MSIGRHQRAPAKEPGHIVELGLHLETTIVDLKCPQSFFVVAVSHLENGDSAAHFRLLLDVALQDYVVVQEQETVNRLRSRAKTACLAGCEHGYLC